MNAASYIFTLQLCFMLGISSCHCQTNFFEEVENLKEYFNASSPDVADGEPLFLDVLRKWNEESDKKIIHSQIVSFYFKLLDTLKDNRMIQTSLATVKETLFIKFFNSSIDKRNDFIKLTQIPVNNLQVQRKAVSELIKVMNELSPRPILRKRKRSRCCFGTANRPNKNHPASAI
ncbi:interferon gamma [Nannospalax galili]|uniref:interferon gamma n=1 Tax=Nannospalax galili TaxID=1026970 RepID=UPI0004ED1E1C|nr:interferon gamma [Nannospalax galili]